MKAEELHLFTRTITLHHITDLTDVKYGNNTAHVLLQVSMHAKREQATLTLKPYILGCIQ